MGPANLFTRRTDPVHWGELWELLAPLGGRTGPQEIQRLADSLKTEPQKRRRTAQKQLARAMALLDTEDNARNLRTDPWRGPGNPFRREGFLAVIQAVIVAGPDAVRRVLNQPMHLASYDTIPADLNARVRAEYEPITAMDAFVIANFPWFTGPTGRIPKKKAWPSLQSPANAQYDFDINDPEKVWLTLDAELLNPEQDGEAMSGAVDWDEAEISAVTRIMTALGPQNPPALASPPVLDISVELVREPSPQNVEDDDDDMDDAYDEDDGELLVSRMVDPALIDAARTSDQRADFLVQQVAQALLSADVGWTSARPPLEELARSAGS